MRQPQQLKTSPPLSPPAPWVLAALAAAACYSWFASGVRTFTRPAEVLTFLPALAVVLLTLRPKARLSAVKDRPSWRTLLAWLLAAVAVVGWELSELFSQPRQGHPTLSSITNTLLSTHPTRFLGFLGWLLLGWLQVRDLGPAREDGVQP